MELRSSTRAADSAADAVDDGFIAAVEQAKLESLYQFAYGLSHEINNPLANITTRAQALLVQEQDPERRRALATIVQQAFRAHEMIADLMLFARPPVLRPEATDLVELAASVTRELMLLANEQGTRLTLTGDTVPLVANVDPTHIAVALRAIVQNSLEAVQAGGSVEVAVEPEEAHVRREFKVEGSVIKVDPSHTANPAIRHPQSAVRNLKLIVSDTGPGISPEARPHLFDPFFSGREAGRGLGLGLSKAWRIIDLHGGSIEVAGDSACGARFEIKLPSE